MRILGGPKLLVSVPIVVACVAGVKRGRGRGNLGERERVVSRPYSQYSQPSFCAERFIDFASVPA